MNLPKVTVITPSFNQAQFITETIESVLNQDYPNLEYIVIDGGSTDGTVDILRAHGARMRWISERDRGQADAVNKGLSMATGEIIGWLNSDDVYAPGAIRRAVEAMQRAGSDMVYGRCEMIGPIGEPLGVFRTLPVFDYQVLTRRDFMAQPTVFFAKSLLGRSGPLDISLYCALDYELWLRMTRHVVPTFVPETQAYYRLHGASKTVKWAAKMATETFLRVRPRFVRGRSAYLFSYVLWGQSILGAVLKATPWSLRLFAKLRWREG